MAAPRPRQRQPFNVNPAAAGGRPRAAAGAAAAGGAPGGLPARIGDRMLEIDRDLWDLIPARYDVLTTRADNGESRGTAKVVKADDSVPDPDGGAVRARALRLQAGERRYPVRYDDVGRLFLRTHPNVMMVSRRVERLFGYVDQLARNTEALKAAVDRAEAAARRAETFDARLAHLEKSVARIGRAIAQAGKK